MSLPLLGGYDATAFDHTSGERVHIVIETKKGENTYPFVSRVILGEEAACGRGVTEETAINDLVICHPLLRIQVPPLGDRTRV